MGDDLADGGGVRAAEDGAGGGVSVVGSGTESVVSTEASVVGGVRQETPFGLAEAAGETFLA